MQALIHVNTFRVLHNCSELEICIRIEKREGDYG
jgi:hypothetical protein